MLMLFQKQFVSSHRLCRCRDKYQSSWNNNNNKVYAQHQGGKKSSQRDKIETDK